MSAPRPAQLWEILYVAADEAGVPLRGARVLRRQGNLAVVQCIDYRKTMPQRIVHESTALAWDDAVLAAMRYTEAGDTTTSDPKQPRFFE